MPPKELQQELLEWYGPNANLLYYNEEAVGLYRTWTFAVAVKSTPAPQLHFGRVFGSIGNEMSISIDRVIDVPTTRSLLEAKTATGSCAHWNLQDTEAMSA